MIQIVVTNCDFMSTDQPQVRRRARSRLLLHEPLEFA
jgi:hypothetical protein